MAGLRSWGRCRCGAGLAATICVGMQERLGLVQDGLGVASGGRLLGYDVQYGDGMWGVVQVADKGGLVQHRELACGQERQAEAS